MILCDIGDKINFLTGGQGQEVAFGYVTIVRSPTCKGKVVINP